VALERRLGLITSQFLAVGSSVAAEAIRLGIARPDNIRAIPSVIDSGIPVATEAGRAEARRRIGVPAGVKLVGTVGRLDYQKAPQDMLAALALLRRDDVWLAWVGGGPLARQTQSLVERKGLSGRVLLLGERNDVPQLLAGFDVFAMSSLYEGIPCALIEAMTCGIPVVATAVNSVPEVVAPGATGLLALPNDPTSLARALSYVLDHPGHAMRMAAAGVTQLGQRFASNALGPTLKEVYSLALSNGTRPPLVGRSAARGGGEP
jgi:glycosyltransferase involved in cell wall biosynthesis